MSGERWIAALPLLLIPCCWLWWWAGGLHPGLETGRAADLLLLAGAAVAGWRMLRRSDTPPHLVLPLLLALAWQALALSWAPVREPGLVWLAERAAACTTAIAIALWMRQRPADRLAAAVAAAGLGILVLTCLTQYGDVGAWLRTNREAPFGNVNFDVNAALPLAAVGLALFLHGGGRRWWFFALATGACAGLLAGGALGGDPCRAVWLGGAVAVASALTLRLPRAAHAPVLLIGAGLLLSIWLATIAGIVDPGSLGAGSAQRVFLWRASGEALLGPAALIGYGPAAAIAVLPEQPAFAAAWLTVPSYAAHAHNEAFQVLLDGGVILAGLLGWALLLTLRPLWQRRAEPAVAALLVGWCTWGALAMIESHLAQPGGLLCLAVLAGVSWGVAPGASLPTNRMTAILPLFMVIALGALIVRELTADGGGPVSIEARTAQRMNGDPHHDLAELDRLRDRLGPLDDLDLRRCRLLGRLEQSDAANAALAGQLRRTPGNAAALSLAARLHAVGQAGIDLLAAESQARTRARQLLRTVRRNPRNGEALDALERVLSPPAADDQAPVH